MAGFYQRISEERMDEWKHHGPRNSAAFRAQKQQVVAALRLHEVVDLLLEKINLERRIDQLVVEWKQLEKAVQTCKKSFQIKRQH